MSEAESRALTAELLQAAAKLFAARGFHAVTLTEIAEATGLPPDELFAVFGGKEGLFYAAIAEARPRVQGPPAGAGIDAPAAESFEAMLMKLEKAGANPRLRAIHRDALERLLALFRKAAVRPQE